MGLSRSELKTLAQGLAFELRGYARRPDVVVLARQPDVVPLAAEVARELPWQTACHQRRSPTASSAGCPR